MKNSERVAFSPGEFAALFGKSTTWGYRQLYAGKVKAITEYGRLMIPAAEVERILDKAGTYEGLKIKVPKKGDSIDPWRKFIIQRRVGKTQGEGKSSGVTKTAESPRQRVLTKLTRGRGKS